MGTPVSREVLVAYLDARRGGLDAEVATSMDEAMRNMPGEVLHWIGNFLGDIAYGDDVADIDGVDLGLGSGDYEASQARRKAIAAAAMNALAGIPEIGAALQARLRNEVIEGLCESYRYLADEWNWTEGPAARRYPNNHVLRDLRERETPNATGKYCGLIHSARGDGEEEFLKSAGVAVAAYDETKKAFIVAMSEEALAQVLRFSADFTVDAFFRDDQADRVPYPEMNQRQLMAEIAHSDFVIAACGPRSQGSGLANPAILADPVRKEALCVAHMMSRGEAQSCLDRLATDAKAAHQAKRNSHSSDVSLVP